MKKNSSLAVFLVLLLCFCACNNSETDKTTQTENKATAEVKSVFINGDSIHYIDVGKGDPVVFIHGVVGDYRTFGAQMDEFAKNHRVIAYSRRFAYPNNQAITDSSKLSVISHAKDLAELIRALNLGKADLVGHSFGANIALIVATDYPELVNRLILAEPLFPSLAEKIPGGDTALNDFITKVFVPIGEAAKINNDQKVVEALVGGVMGDSTYYSRLPQRDIDIMKINTPETKGIVAAKDVFPLVSCDDVKKVKAPVLLVKGDKSPAIFSMMINELNRCLDKSEVATLTNTSHGLEYENPEGFNKPVLAFLNKQ